MHGIEHRTPRTSITIRRDFGVMDSRIRVYTASISANGFSLLWKSRAVSSWRILSRLVTGFSRGLLMYRITTDGYMNCPDDRSTTEHSGSGFWMVSSKNQGQGTYFSHS